MFTVFLAMLLALGPAQATVPRRRAACPDYALVVARGTFEPQGPSLGFSGLGTPGMTNQTFAQVPNGIEYDVVYPANASPTSEAKGGADAVAYIERSRAACPSEKFALLGYSQGATVALEVLQHFAPADGIIAAVVLLGNPYQKKNQVSTVDQNGGASTRGNDGSLLFTDPGLALSERLAESGKVLNICYTGDVVCNGLKLNTINDHHLLYPSSASVQALGTRLLVSQLA